LLITNNWQLSDYRSIGVKNIEGEYK